jgi:hypothetical protein
MKPTWYFIIFAPGMGGNHLANLMSTCSELQPRIEESYYDNLGKNAHPDHSKFYRPQVGEPKSTGTTSKKFKLGPGNHVVCVHLAEYLWNKQILESMEVDRKFLVIEFPEQCHTDLFYKRIIQLYPYYKDIFLINELSTLYATDIVRLLCKADDVTPVTVDKIFNKDASNLVRYLNQNFDIHWDNEKIQQMHTKWIEMIEHS